MKSQLGSEQDPKAVAGVLRDDEQFRAFTRQVFTRCYWAAGIRKDPYTHFCIPWRDPPQSVMLCPVLAGGPAARHTHPSGCFNLDLYSTFKLLDELDLVCGGYHPGPSKSFPKAFQLWKWQQFKALSGQTLYHFIQAHDF